MLGAPEKQGVVRTLGASKTATPPRFVRAVAAWRRRMLYGVALWLSCSAAAGVVAQQPARSITAVPEMAPLLEVVQVPATDRQRLASSAQNDDVLSAAQRAAVELWPRILELDFHQLSRAQRDVTEGWAPPRAAPEFAARALGVDGEGQWHVELRGSRLPTRYDIVVRTLTLYLRVDPQTLETSDTIVTIRTEVFE